MHFVIFLCRCMLFVYPAACWDVAASPLGWDDTGCYLLLFGLGVEGRAEVCRVQPGGSII